MAPVDLFCFILFVLILSGVAGNVHGVVLIELLSSMPAIDMTRRRDEINLSNLAIMKIQQSAFSELVDPCLGFDTNSEVKRMMVSVAELAFQCLQRDKELRPSMDEVLKMLIRIQSGREMAENLDEEDLRPPSLPSPDWEENVLAKKVMLHYPSLTHIWHSTSESSSPNTTR